MSNLPVLIIDDETAVLKGLKMLLALNDLPEPVTAESYEDALPFLGSVSMVLLDITMPGTDGITALTYIRKSHPDLPVVMVTGISDLHSAVTCMKSGARDYLTKPVDEEQLLDCIRSVSAIDSILKTGESADELLLIRQKPQRAGDQFDSICAWSESLIDLTFTAIPVQLQDNFEQFRQFIISEKNFADNEISLRMVAANLGTNESTLSKIVNTGFSMSFRTLVNRLRLSAFVRHVKNDALETMTIEGVASLVGFERPGTFYAAFKSESGLTPREWLNKHCQILNE